MTAPYRHVPARIFTDDDWARGVTLARWLEIEGADTSDPGDCMRAIYRSASSLTRCGLTVSDAERLVLEASRHASQNPVRI